MNNAPIALFVYNRPEHTRRTVEALAKNSEAQDSVLHIFSDAAKTSVDAASVEAVRNYIRTIDGFKQVVLVERPENFGLARSIIDGVTNLCDRYGRVIVLEDDLETSLHFLRYMNDALDFYADEPRVMHISGCRYPVEPFGQDDTFFLHVPLCWGWATWKRAWVTFEKDVAIMQRFDRKMIDHFDFDNTYTYWKQLELNKSGKMNTWFVFWYANLFLRRGLALFPAQSLVRNIGMDKSGTHSPITNDYDVVLCRTPVVVTQIPLVESSVGYQCHSSYFGKIHMSLFRRIKRKLSNWAAW